MFSSKHLVGSIGMVHSYLAGLLQATEPDAAWSGPDDADVDVGGCGMFHWMWTAEIAPFEDAVEDGELEDEDEGNFG